MLAVGVPAISAVRARAWCEMVRRVRVVGRILVAVVAAWFACAGLSAAAPAGPAATGASASRPVVLAVWGLVDGDRPVAGASVDVYAGAPRRPNRSGRLAGSAPLPELTAARTSKTGAALVEFSRLPREFTVELTGGSVGGKRVKGALRVLVRGYRSGGVAYVNPITTLIADETAAAIDPGHRSSPAIARRRIYRLLGIPGWIDNTDLSYTDRYFDGARYLAAARRVGGVAALDRTLVRRALAGGPPRRFAASGENPSARVAGVNWLALTGTQLVTEIFKALSVQAGKSLASVGLTRGGEATLGWILAGFGYSDVLKDQDILQIRQAVQALGKQITALQGDLALSGFSTLVHQTDQTVGQVEYATSQLALLASLPDKDTTKRAFAQTISDYIGSKLLDAPQILNQSLGSNVPITDNLIKSASRLVSQRSRFFDSQSSAQVKSVYDYFALYQAQLAVVLQEYYHAKPETYAATVREANLAKLAGNVTAQAVSLKPNVPPRTVVDTRTLQMWVQELPTPEVNLNSLGEIIFPRRPIGYKPKAQFRRKAAAGPTGLPDVPFGDWEIPTIGEFEGLVSGWTGASPLAWLEKEGRFGKSLLDAGAGRKWTRDGFKLGKPFIATPLHITRFALNTGQTIRQMIEWFGGGWRGEFEKQRAGLMYRRKLSAGETYWWSSQ